MLVSRRGVVRGGLAVSSAFLIGHLTGGLQTASASAGTGGIVWRDPGCGCCGAWVEHMAASGFQLESQMTDDLAARKEALGVPVDLQSCHTAEIAGYLVEGHVPAKDVLRLLTEKPDGALGLAVPGMPVGAPGMEMGPRVDPYQVVIWYKDGRVEPYAQYGVPV